MSKQTETLENNENENTETEVVLPTPEEIEAIRQEKEAILNEKKELENKYNELLNSTKAKEKDKLKEENNFEQLWQLAQEEINNFKERERELQEEQDRRDAELIGEKFLNELEAELNGTFFDREIAKKSIDFKNAVLEPNSNAFNKLALQKEANKILEKYSFLVKPKNPSLDQDKTSGNLGDRKEKRNWKDALKDAI